MSKKRKALWFLGDVVLLVKGVNVYKRHESTYNGRMGHSSPYWQHFRELSTVRWQVTGQVLLQECLERIRESLNSIMDQGEN